jgi:hypothetical protein
MVAKPKKPKHGRAALKKLRDEWVTWLAKGMPAREPVSRAEIERRIEILDEALRER